MLPKPVTHPLGFVGAPEYCKNAILKTNAGISRAIFVTARSRRVVVVRVFVKQSRKTPRREIDLALERAREVR